MCDFRHNRIRSTVLYKNVDISYPKIVMYKFLIRNIKLFVEDSTHWSKLAFGLFSNIIYSFIDTSKVKKWFMVDIYNLLQRHQLVELISADFIPVFPSLNI